MLVLSRRNGEKLVFPNLDIEVEVLQVRGKTVKLGITAPKEIVILRAEASEQPHLENRAAEIQADTDRHRLRKHLKAINAGVRMFHQESETGCAAQAESSIERVIAELQQMDEEIGEARQKVQQVAPSRAVRVLVVEDDDKERDVLAALLRLHGFEVTKARDGDEAIAKFCIHEQPDFVLLDINLPDRDERSTLRKLRSDTRFANLSIFAISGTSPRESGFDESNYSGWFPKPLDPDRLIQTLTADHRMLTSA